MSPENSETELFGKLVSDLQTNIAVGSNKKITGTLKYVTGYTGFSGDPALQSGNYIAMKVTATAGTTTTVEVVGGHSGPVTLDSDMNFVLRIENKNQKIKLVSTKNGVTETEIFSLADITLEAAPAAG